MSKASKYELYQSRLTAGLCPCCGRERDKFKGDGTTYNICKLCLSKVHPASRKQKESRASKQYHWNLRLAVIALYGNKCVRCGFSDPRALQLDHKKGGGRQALRKDKYYYGYLKELLANPDYETLQLLCANCNWIKRYENNENPNVVKSMEGYDTLTTVDLYSG